MILLSENDVIPEEWEGTAVSIGAYDGVHLGHRALIGEMRSRAEVIGLMSVVVTFDRHPAAVVRPGSAPRLLTDLDQKLDLLASTGIDGACVVAFDERRSAQSPEEFVREILVGRLRARLVVVGSDFHFGKGRAGNLSLLSSMGRSLGFGVEGVELMPGTLTSGQHGDVLAEAISSTRIRALLDEGRVEAAAALLGRDHEVAGDVVRGDGRGGSELGFPTANLAVGKEILVPAHGIYAGWCALEDRRTCPMVASIGTRPTFYPGVHDALVEAHILDFDEDLYGKRLGVRFHRRLRDELTFESAGALVEQMLRDVEAARRTLGI